MAKKFSYEQAEELAAAFKRHGVRYLLIGKSGAIVLGFPDTTQDADVFLDKTVENGRRVVLALREIGFDLDPKQSGEIERCKDFIQLKNGPFDLDLIFAPDGIETFEEARGRSFTIEGINVCCIEDIIKSKEATGRVKDRESLPRLKAFQKWLKERSSH